jgi:predicted metal-binding membrane protein
MKTASAVPSAIARPGRDTYGPAVVAAALFATVGLGSMCWVVTIRRMNGMDLGVGTRLGSFAYFSSVWVTMMAAMMLPGAAPAALRLAQRGVRVLDLPRYVGSYLGVWALVGVVVFAVYRPHGAATAGVLAVAAGVYELTPVKRRFRQMCRETVPSGFGLGLCCVGSSIGLMVMMAAVGIMSLSWMAVTTGVVFIQKLLSPRLAIDVPMALAIVALGIAIMVAPSSVPGIVPATHAMPSI